MYVSCQKWHCCFGQRLIGNAIIRLRSEVNMKRIIYLFLVLIITSCKTDMNEIEQLKYSKADLKPLHDATKNQYYQDAAFIEFEELIKDSIKKANQVELNENSILSYYDDLLYIYNNSFKISNTFFEYAALLHSYASSVLYQITLTVDTNKSWSSNWKNGMKSTGLQEIDSIIYNHNLDVRFVFESQGKYWYEIKSKAPLNYLSLIKKLKETEEFVYVEPTVLIGGGSNISFKIENNYRHYKYYYGWGDCPSGCINYHYWTVELKGEEIILVEEGGYPLN